MKNKIIHIVVLTEEILNYFVERKKGIYSDFAYHGLLICVNAYFDGNKKQLMQEIDITYDMNKNDFKFALKRYKLKIKEMKDYGFV